MLFFHSHTRSCVLSITINIKVRSDAKRKSKPGENAEDSKKKVRAGRPSPGKRREVAEETDNRNTRAKIAQEELRNEHAMDADAGTTGERDKRITEEFKTPSRQKKKKDDAAEGTGGVPPASRAKSARGSVDKADDSGSKLVKVPASGDKTAAAGRIMTGSPFSPPDKRSVEAQPSEISEVAISVLAPGQSHPAVSLVDLKSQSVKRSDLTRQSWLFGKNK